MISAKVDSMPERLDALFSISSEHPSLEGHFPGHPVVPAVVLLNEVERLVKQKCFGFRLSEFTQAKFMQLVFPGQNICLQADMDVANDTEIKVKFTLMNEDGRLCVKGSCLFFKELEL